MPTSKWTFTPPDELREMIGDMSLRSTDWSPVMQPIAQDMRRFIRDVVFPTEGEGKWVPMAESTIERWGARPLLQLRGHTSRRLSSRYGGGSGLREHTGADWSRRNAVAVNAAPHAHLMEGGVRRYVKPKYQVKGKRLSRAASRQNTSTGTQHVPAREFMYVSDERMESLYGPMLLDFFFGEFVS